MDVHVRADIDNGIDDWETDIDGGVELIRGRHALPMSYLGIPP